MFLQRGSWVVLVISVCVLVAVVARDGGVRSRSRRQMRVREGRRDPGPVAVPDVESESLEVVQVTEEPETEEPEQCVTIGVTLNKQQYEEICPVREIANLRKQIHDVKHVLRNNTTVQSPTISRELNDTIRGLETDLYLWSGRLDQLQGRVEDLETATNEILDRRSSDSQQPISSRVTEDRLAEMQAQIQELLLRVDRLEDIPIPPNCVMVQREGVFLIQPEAASSPFRVFCEGSWTVILRRVDGSENFYRNWEEYKLGFGNLTDEFWLGNDHIHTLSNIGTTRLRIEAEDWNSTYYWAEFDEFRIANESDAYRLHVAGHQGNLSNALYTDLDSHFCHSGQPFSTYDRDQDGSLSASCARTFMGAYWYNDCYVSNPTGPYCSPDEHHSRCMAWYTHEGRIILKAITWKILVSFT